MQGKPRRSADPKRSPMRVVLGMALTVAAVLTVTTVVPGGEMGGIALTPRASADQIWFQSVGRASADAPCEESPAADLIAGWTPWAPSWEDWANGGTGGFVCSRQITWAYDTAPPGPVGRTSPFGEIGPGGGLIFLRAGGRTYEMAPKDWGNDTTGFLWCNNNVAISTNTSVGTGSANTALMLAACSAGDGAGGSGSITSAAHAASAYRGGGFTDWYLPSKDELNAMCNFSRNPAAPADPTTPCNNTGDPFAGLPQDTAFANGDFGFSGPYWSSSFHSLQGGFGKAWAQYFSNGNFADLDSDGRTNYYVGVRPIRSY